MNRLIKDQEPSVSSNKENSSDEVTPRVPQEIDHSHSIQSSISMSIHKRSRNEQSLSISDINMSSHSDSDSDPSEVSIVQKSDR